MHDADTLESRYGGLLHDVERIVRPIANYVDLNELARHNTGLAAYGPDVFGRIIQNERGRYLRVVDRIIGTPRGKRVLDLGSFVPYLPLLLSKMGFEVTVVDRYELYGDGFKQAIFDVANREGINVREIDILSDELLSLPEHDHVLLLAVVEHLSGSPRALMGNVRTLIARGGSLIFDVPNIAELSKRLRLLRGRSPLPDYTTYFESEYPFMGHNREMTASEVRYLLERSGFEVIHLENYDYSGPPPQPTVKLSAIRIARRIVPVYLKEAILAEGCPTSHS